MLIEMLYGREIAWRRQDFMEEGWTELKYETCLEFQQGRSGEKNITQVQGDENFAEA